MVLGFCAIWSEGLRKREEKTERERERRSEAMLAGPACVICCMSLACCLHCRKVRERVGETIAWMSGESRSVSSSLGLFSSTRPSGEALRNWSCLAIRNNYTASKWVWSVEARTRRPPASASQPRISWPRSVTPETLPRRHCSSVRDGKMRGRVFGRTDTHARAQNCSAASLLQMKIYSRKAIYTHAFMSPRQLAASLSRIWELDKRLIEWLSESHKISCEILSSPWSYELIYK